MQGPQCKDNLALVNITHQQVGCWILYQLQFLGHLHWQQGAHSYTPVKGKYCKNQCRASHSSYGHNWYFRKNSANISQALHLQYFPIQGSSPSHKTTPSGDAIPFRFMAENFSEQRAKVFSTCFLPSRTQKLQDNESKFPWFLWPDLG